MANNQTKIVFNVEAEISQIKKAAQDIEKSFGNLNLSQSVQKSLSSTFSNLTKNIQDFEVAAAKGFSSLNDVNKGQQNLEKINEGFTKIKVVAKDLGNIDLKKLLPDNLINKYKKLEDMLKKVGNLQAKDNSKAIQTATNKYDAQLKKVETLRSKLSGLQKENQSTGGSTTGLQTNLRNAEGQAKLLVQRMTELENIRGGKNTAEYKSLNAELQKVNQSIKVYSAAINENKIKVSSNKAEIQRLTEQLKGEEINLTALETKLKNLTAQGIDTSALKTLRQDLANLLGVNLEEVPKNLEGIKNKIVEASANSPELQKIAQYIQNISLNAEGAKTQVGGLADKFKTDVKDSAVSAANLNSEMDMLKSRLTYFFSALNGIQLFKNAIRSAYNSVKELDAAITEMSVVTNYSINDIWGQVPKYTQTAVELGATTKDVINSMVLYTQQGLEMSKATELSTQTMKMARIAGLEGAEATDLMTAALRGFNMELNETSAQRVNDVYSNLAAHAAANTHEIADAMTRTASIANSAGMEFENTAAFLTQMIETTRESAENLGTAMKTIVARFTEMKKAPTGIVDVEGEEVNVNKVEAALKSVGVQLRDTTGQFRDLDDVFLELSSKWDSLDKMSQRYVATTAAGSRQQSRFIAMMSNYQRTMELTGYATNSAGASQKQFEKTMDSLESKLNRLHDAWEQYVTGMANQSAIKGVVDLLTNLISGLNKFTDAIDPARTGWSKLLVTILGFKAAKGIINGVVKNLGAQLAIGMGKKGAEVGTSFSKTFINKIKNIKVGVVGSQSTKEAVLANKELAAAQQEAKIASDNLTAAQERQAAVVKSTSINIKEAEGVEATRAAREKAYAARMGASTAVINAKTASEEANNKVKEKEIAVNKLVANSENRLQRVHSLSILQRLNLARIMIFGSAEKKKQILMNYGLATSEEADAIASGNAAAGQTAFNIALEACPIMWIITAIAALVAGLALLCSWLDKAAKAEKEKYEARMEGAAKATEDAAEKAKEAKEAFDELLENKGTYNKLQEELKNLVKGSDEYLQKVQEIKDNIDKMVKLNPEIGKYVTYDKNGVPTISPEGQRLAVEETKKQAYLMEIQSNASAMKDAWKEYMEHFKAGGEDGYVVAGEDLKFITRKSAEINAPTEVQTANELRKNIGYTDNEPIGLSTKWFQELGRAYVEKKITDKETDGYIKIGKYYIEQAAYNKLRKVALTINNSFDTYDEEYDKTREGQEHYRHTDARGNYITTPLQRTLDDSSLIKAIDQIYKNSIQSFSTLSQKVEYAYKSALATEIGKNEGVSLSQADAFASFYSKKIMDNADITTIIDNFNKKFDHYAALGIEELENAYEKKFGDFNAEAAGIEENEDASDEEKEKNKEAKKGYMASRLATQEVFGIKIEEQAKVYIKLMNEHSKIFTNILSVASKNIDDTINEGLVKNLLQFSDVTKILNDEYRQVLKELGISEQEFQQLWTSAKANLQQNLKTGVELFFKDNTGENKNNKAYTELVTGKIGKVATQNFGYLAAAWNKQVGQLESGLTFDTSNILSKFFNTGLFKDAKAATEVYERLSRIDFSKPSQAAKEIANLAKDTNKEYSDLGKHLKTVTADIISLSRQTKYIWNSIDEETKKNLFEDGEATAEEIKKLCEQLPEMAALLDANSLSASTLAKYFNQVQSGMLNIETASSNYLLALDKVNKAQNIITDSLDFVKEFEASESQQKITDSISEWRDSMQQSLQRGQFGDQNLIDYSKAILGLENWNKYFTEFDGNLQKIEELAFSKINLWKDNFYNMWADFAGKSSSVSVGKAGEIIFDLTNISSIDELKQQLMDTYDFSEEMAEAAIADAQTYSSELSKAFKTLSLGDSLKTLIEGGIKDELNRKISIDKKELSAIAAEAGIAFQELIGLINENLKQVGYSLNVNDILDEAGQLTQEKIDEYIQNIKEELNKEQKKLIIESKIDNKQILDSITPHSFNLDKMYSEMLSAGMKPDQIKQQMKAILTEATKELSANGDKVFYYWKDGILNAFTGGLTDKSKLAKSLNISEDMLYDSIDSAVSGGMLSGLQDPKVRAQKELDSIETMKQTAVAVAMGMQIASGKPIKEWAAKLYDNTTKAIDSALQGRKAYLQGVIDSVDTSELTNFSWDFGKINLGSYAAYLTQESQEGWTDKEKEKEEKEEEKKDEWINDWDRQTDVLKKIENLERERNKLAKEQERYLKKNILREQEVFNIKEKQRKNIMQQMRLNEQLAKDAESWLRGMNNDGNFDGAIWWDESSKRVRTNDAYIRSMDEDTKKEFDKVRSDYEHYENQFNTANDNMSSLTDTLEDLTETVVELDYHNNTERLIEVIERTIDLYDKAAKRLEWTEKQVSSQKVLELYDAKSKEFIAQFNASTDDFIQTESEINAMLNKQNYKKYYTYDWKTGKVTTTGAYDAITDKDYKNQVADFVNKLANLFKQRSEDESKRIDVQEQQRAADRELIDKAESFGKNVYDAVINQREKEISELENINTSIQNAASELVSSIQKNIQKIRQDRTNKKTEEELYKMQSKLDFLRIDTSTGNQKAILDLEKQLDDKQQSYTDSLIDQKINELQDQNKEAEKQRKEQIDIMKAQLDYDKDNGIIWRDVRYLIANGLAKNGNIVAGSDLDTALKQWGKYNSLSTQGQKDWMHEQNLGGSYYNAYNFSGGNQRNYAGQYTYGVSSEQLKTLQQNSVEAYKQGLIQSVNKTTPYKDYMYYDANSNVLKQTKLFPNEKQNKTLHDLLQATWKQVWDTINTINSINAYYNKNSANNIVFTQVPSIARFASGGLADFTGPAWLDGTKTSPEMVLNARDTENFIQLKNILGNIMDSGVTSTNNGDFYFEIKIDVDKMNSDYDVDQVVNRIKQQIINEARYRNVNTINMIR